MKKLLFPIILILFSLVLAACGDDDEVTDPALDDTGGSDDQTTEQEPADDGVTDDTAGDPAGEEGTQDDAANLQDRYIFIEFKLDADIDNQDDAVEIEFDAEPNDVEAKYIDRTQDIELRGDAALEELDSIFTAFRFNEDATDDEILDEVFEAFNIPDTATDIDLDIEFSNGAEREIER